MPAPTTPYQPYQKLHEKPNGAGDQRPTAMRVLDDEGLVGEKLKGKVFLITGCSAGIGIETARALHATGADVFMTVRDTKREQGEQIIRDIKASSNGCGKLELVLMDLSSFASIRTGAGDFLKRTSSLNVLIENAGVMMCPCSRTAEGYEMQIGTNHFGHFLLFQLLKERLLASATSELSSRVVIVSSAGHRSSPIRFDDMNFEKEGYNRIKGYGQSKTANIYMASSIERHYSHLNLHATSVHPGVIFDTGLGKHQTPESIDKDFDMSSLIPISKSLQQGAATQVWAATARYFNDKGGVYLADVGEAGPWREGMSAGAPAYAPHAYDEEQEERFWKLSCAEAGVGET